MARNPTWSRDELILALDLYLRHRERLPDSDDPEVVELSLALNALYGERARDASLFRNPNGVYMKLANFRAVDPLYTSQGKRGLQRGGYGTEEVWTEFSERPDRLKLIASAIREAAAALPHQADNDDDIAEALEGRLLTSMHRTRERNRELIRKKREAVLRETGRLACEACASISMPPMERTEPASSKFITFCRFIRLSRGHERACRILRSSAPIAIAWSTRNPNGCRFWN